jgi:hypothetical protein
MKAKSPVVPAFLNPRALIGFGFSAVGLLLALLGFLAFPSSALATPQCSDVTFTEHVEAYGTIYVQMSSDPGCTIYYTVRSLQLPSDPTHSSAIYNPGHNPNYQGLGVGVGAHLWYKALAYNASSTPVDSGITIYEVDNTQN